MDQGTKPTPSTPPTRTVGVQFSIAPALADRKPERVVAIVTAVQAAVTTLAATRRPKHWPKCEKCAPDCPWQCKPPLVRSYRTPTHGGRGLLLTVVWDEPLPFRWKQTNDQLRTTLKACGFTTVQAERIEEPAGGAVAA